MKMEILIQLMYMMGQQVKNITHIQELLIHHIWLILTVIKQHLVLLNILTFIQDKKDIYLMV